MMNNNNTSSSHGHARDVMQTPSTSLVSDALKYYDENSERYMKIRKSIKYRKHKNMCEEECAGSNTNPTMNNIKTDHRAHSFYDKDKNILFTSRTELVGKYFTESGVWVWGWALPMTQKSDATIIRKLFMYGTDINAYNNDSDDFEKILLKVALITSRTLITDVIQIDIYCALASYLSKHPFIIPMIYGEEDNDGYVPFIDHFADGVDAFSDLNVQDAVINHGVYFHFIIDPPDV